VNAPLQPRYDPLSSDERRNNPEWIRRNAATFSWGNGDHAEAQEIDPRYRERHYSFRDILESFNPIQHLPILGQMYRDATGTQLHPIARIVAGAATGPVGGVSAFANVALESATGRDLSGHVLDAVTGRQHAPGQQLAGGSWIYDPTIGQSSTTPGTPASSDPTAAMAAAPAGPTLDPSAAARAQRRRSPQVAPPPPAPPSLDAQAQAPQTLALAAAPGAVMPRDVLAASGAGGAGGMRAPVPAQLAAQGGMPPVQGPAQAQLQPGPALAQMLSAQGVQAAQSGQGRNIQQYFVLAGTRPPSAESARAVPLNPPPGTVRFGPQPAASSAPPQDTQAQPGAQPGTPANAAPSGDPNDRSWFTAAMLHGVERYRDTRRAQDGEQPSVDRTE
jgi:hypothetical protein